jgi:hypothetical protein
VKARMSLRKVQTTLRAHGRRTEPEIGQYRYVVQFRGPCVDQVGDLFSVNRIPGCSACSLVLLIHGLKWSLASNWTLRLARALTRIYSGRKGITLCATLCSNSPDRHQAPALWSRCLAGPVRELYSFRFLSQPGVA